MESKTEMNVEKYYGGDGSDALESVNSILNAIHYDSRSEIEIYDENTGLPVDTPVSSGIFAITLYVKPDKYYNLSGVVNKKDNGYESGAELEPIDFP